MLCTPVCFWVSVCVSVVGWFLYGGEGGRVCVCVRVCSV